MKQTYLYIYCFIFGIVALCLIATMQSQMKERETVTLVCGAYLLQIQTNFSQIKLT